jgi:hypothetical protein
MNSACHPLNTKKAPAGTIHFKLLTIILSCTLPAAACMLQPGILFALSCFLHLESSAFTPYFYTPEFATDMQLLSVY